ncbi:MAG: pyridoxamine 5'-phosphate oxidase family protein [Acidimicrobiia bacterium]
MANNDDRARVEEILTRNRYLILSTTDGDMPWIAPLEYLLDEDLDFYFFSPEDSLHAQHIEQVDRVAVAVFDEEQPEYSCDLSVSLNGVQIEGTARKLTEDQYNETIVSAIDALKPPMPPYAVFKIETHRFHVPKIENGRNVREEVDMTG